MTQFRNLTPVTVYLPPEILAELEKEARATAANTSQVIRTILAKWRSKR